MMKVLKTCKSFRNSFTLANKCDIVVLGKSLAAVLNQLYTSGACISPP